MILDVINDKKLINIDRIRKTLNKRYSRKLGWVTIKRHMDYLLTNGKIKIDYETDEGKKKDRLYRIEY